MASINGLQVVLSCKEALLFPCKRLPVCASRISCLASHAQDTMNVMLHDSWIARVAAPIGRCPVDTACLVAAALVLLCICSARGLSVQGQSCRYMPAVPVSTVDLFSAGTLSGHAPSLLH